MKSSWGWTTPKGGEWVGGWAGVCVCVCVCAQDAFAQHVDSFGMPVSVMPYITQKLRQICLLDLPE